MKIEDFLQDKLNITEEEASKIANALHEYKNLYGKHHHHHEESNNEDIYSMISETKEECLTNNYELEKIHCNGCPNNCNLVTPKCGRGEMLKNEFSKNQKESTI